VQKWDKVSGNGYICGIARYLTVEFDGLSAVFDRSSKVVKELLDVR
jgi:hypothetical protein